VLRQQVAQMQALSKEAAALSGKSAAPLIAMSKENIEAALARNGLKPQSVMLTGDFAKVQLAAVSFAGTLNWLDDMQKTALLSVVDANIVALAQPDMVNATFTLRQPGKD
jgi:general secretion pathway protein M